MGECVLGQTYVNFRAGFEKFGDLICQNIAGWRLCTATRTHEHPVDEHFLWDRRGSGLSNLRPLVRGI